MTGPSDDGGSSSDDDDFFRPPPQFDNRPNSYNSSLWPFANDPSLDNSEFGFFQELYKTGFADPGASPNERMRARSEFIEWLSGTYGQDFDWDTWREEYESYG